MNITETSIFETYKIQPDQINSFGATFRIAITKIIDGFDFSGLSDGPAFLVGFARALKCPQIVRKEGIGSLLEVRPAFLDPTRFPEGSEEILEYIVDLIDLEIGRRQTRNDLARNRENFIEIYPEQ